MAKVRVQARSADLDQAKDVKDTQLPTPNTFHHKKTHHPGAFDILVRVLQKEGFRGWYQVSLSASFGSMCTDMYHYFRACKHRSLKRSSRKDCCSCQKNSLRHGQWLSFSSCRGRGHRHESRRGL
jgi:hypothetical protein